VRLAGEVRPLEAQDLADSFALSQLAFGGDPAATPPETPGPGVRYGIRDDAGRLVAQAQLNDFVQWWGGRRVPMGGVASVAVHPDAQGSGLARRLMAHLLEVMHGRGQVVSALFPTIAPLYRSMGWEVVGRLDETRLATRELAPREASTCTVRTGTAEFDADAVQALYAVQAATGNGPLTRTGPMFADGAAEAFDCDVVLLAEDPLGQARGYLSYDRGRGYRDGAGELHVWETAVLDADAARALLAALARWHPVAGTTLWRGPPDELTLLTTGPVPPPATTQPWMLRVVDPAGAMAARGYDPAVEVTAAFTLVDPQQPAASRTWRLEVAGGRGRLEPAVDPAAPVLDVRGLALLYAGATTTATLLRTGLLSKPVRALDAAFAGPSPVLTDYF
jgi:predicted acetyltransferase